MTFMGALSTASARSEMKKAAHKGRSQRGRQQHAADQTFAQAWQGDVSHASFLPGEAVSVQSRWGQCGLETSARSHRRSAWACFTPASFD
jgi:hypothetical protein